MILKASQRSGAKQLGAHLLKMEENEHVEVHEVSGFVADTVQGAMMEAYALSKGTKCQQYLFSVSLKAVSTGADRDALASLARDLVQLDPASAEALAKKAAELKAGEAKRRIARIAAAGAIWKAAGPVGLTVAEIYLRTARLIGAPLDRADLRFHPAAPLFPYSLADCDRCPALVAAVRDRRGRFTGAHLTYLRPDGRGKADVKPARKMVGTVGGGHVCLIPGRRLVVAEGLESTLSAWAAANNAVCRSAGDLGAVSTLSAGGMAAFEWPAGTATLLIAPDRDANGTGERAGQSLARRAHAEGLGVGFLRPPEGTADWNALAMRNSNR